MDELFIVIGTVQTKGRYLEFWVEGWSASSELAEQYASRLNAINARTDDPEEVVYLALSAFALNGEELADYGDMYDA